MIITWYGVEYGIFVIITLLKCTRMLSVTTVKSKAVHNKRAELMGWY